MKPAFSHDSMRTSPLSFFHIFFTSFRGEGLGMFLYFLAITVLFGSTSYAQYQPQMGNQKTIGGSNADYPARIVKLANSYLVVGSSSSGVSGDRTEELKGNLDIWLLELDESFNSLWQRSYGGDNGEGAATILHLPDEKYLIGGRTTSSASGDIDSLGFGEFDFWVFCINNIGEILWQNVIGGSEGDGLSSVIALDDGRFILGGYSASSISGYKSENSRGLYDYWIVCIDSAGQVLWDRTYGGSSSDQLRLLLHINEDELLLVGNSSSYISGEKSEHCYGSTDFWVIKVQTSNGDIIWDRTYGGSDLEQVSRVLLIEEAVYLIGSSSSPVSGTKSEPSLGGGDYWLVKIDMDGNIIWDRTIGGSSNDFANGAVFDSVNNQIILVGSSGSNVSGHKTEPGFGGADYWVVGVDTSGNVLWDKTIGGSEMDYPNFIFNKGENSFILGGRSDSDISGVKEDYCRGDFDFWLVEINVVLSFEEVFMPEVKTYPNPFSELLYMEFPDDFMGKEVAIFNTLGQMVYRQGIVEKKQVISANELKPGSYFVQLIDGTSVKPIGKLIRK